MIRLSFPTKKLRKYIKRVNVKLKDTKYNQNDLIVYGVTNTEGITITGNQTSEDLSNYIVLKENQLVYNPYRVNVGSIGLTPKGLLGLVSPAYIVFETTEDLNAEFLYYYLKSSLGINLIKWYGDRGGVRSALRYEDLCEIDIPDLNLIQQMYVLNKMKKVSTEIEKYNSEICYQEELISKLRQSILQEAVQGKLVPQDPNDESASVLLERIKKEKERLIKESKIKKEKPLPPISEDEIPYELPEGWEWVRFEKIARIASKPVNPEKYPNMFHIAPDNIEKGTGKLLLYRTVIEDGVKSVNHYFYPGQILYSKIRPNLSKAVIVEFEGLCSADIYPIVSYINTKYLLYFILSKTFLNQVVLRDNRVKMPKINQNDLNKVLVAVPPLNEQKRIVEKVDQLMALCDELEKNIEQSKKDSELLMQSVLQEAFKGA